MRDADAYARAHEHFCDVGNGGDSPADDERGVRARGSDPRAYLPEDGARDEGAKQPLRHARKSVDKISDKPFFEDVQDIFPRKLGFYLLFLCG